MARTLIIIPTYNERDNIASTVGRVRASVPAGDVLVVDDSSPDGTGHLADALAAADSQVHTLHRTRKNGLGAAYLEAFTWGLSRGYDQLVQLDADGSHLPEQLSTLLAAADSADVVLGSRWVSGGAVENWPWHRRLLSKGGSVYSRILLRLRQRDVTGGYRVYSAHALEHMDLSTVDSLGYCFQIDMLLRAVRSRLTVVEVPITFVERTLGSSKMNGSIVAEAMARVTIWGLTGRNARRAAVLAPASVQRGH
ncbi:MULTISPECIES: polyprenol monophosphomannose synthase [Cryobacterium]|uniref:Polyprenol monophosphomannose synthase n=1 Tax=Cryobacterium breve TaxID=1259258 RepID=A0ABY2IYN7_9MICO|nr:MULTISPECIES: polyprenol monophosphomannose synthase [Cryobacterium]TFC90558.1 polyprenol monophosphomannose synthase [Cryobacterium sp. TmT3-12]TFC95648.1 polyprenol monophosphomannose synthase [Cryobacterium breve]